MENKRFRNHYSVVIENVGTFLVVIALLLVQNINNFEDVLEGIQNGEDVAEYLPGALFGVGIVLLIMVAVIAVSSFIWAKTWITIEPLTILMERNTLNRVKNTIGMRNISNVNIEQNIFEKIIGTCKVKLDTGSLSTANKTDIKIVLKLSQGRAIKRMILERVNEAQGMRQEAAGVGNVQMENSSQGDLQGDSRDAKPRDSKLQGESASSNFVANHILDTENMVYDIVATGKDIFLHGICSVNISTIILLIGCIGGMGAAFTTFRESLTGSLASVLLNLLIVFGIIFSCAKDLAMGFIKYYNFKVARRGDKLYVHYGLFKTLDYTIPVSKINGIVIHQTLIGRIAHKYMVEVINVGMGDEEGESGAYMILACDRNQLQQYLEQLLPEFATTNLEQIRRQPKEIWISKAIKAGIWSILLIIPAAALCIFVSYVKPWMAILACTLMIGYGILCSVLDYLTSGSYMNEQQVVAAKGCFRRDVVLLTYERIQYLKLNTNVVMRHFGLVKGNAFLLAGIANQEKVLPWMYEAELEPVLRENFCRR